MHHGTLHDPFPQTVYQDLERPVGSRADGLWLMAALVERYERHGGLQYIAGCAG